MAERDYASTPICDALGVRAVIDGLAHDLQELRHGTITPADAMTRAHLARQYFNGARLILAALRTIDPPARPTMKPEGLPDARSQAET
ncbi:MAG TPA: hypothetical protein PKD10_16125 [Paracoccaceae bacterium]|nr:hypothetical protein [Paracoccaceae bacterium]HMO73630.1 hypothetical protein [Paracoccaceae bacterium]